MINTRSPKPDGVRQDGQGLQVLLVTVAWPTEKHPQSGIFVSEQVEWLRKAGVEIDVFTFSAGVNPLNYLRARRSIRRRLRSGSYDLIHVHFGHAGWAVPRRSPPMVVTFHGSDLEGIVGPGGRYVPRSHLLRRISRSVARRASEVVVQSERTAARLPQGVAYERVPMGVDLERFSPASKEECREGLGFPLERRMVLFCGDPDAPVKRFALAQEAVALLADRNADLVTMRGLSREEVVRHMNASDALLVTSLHESGPITVKEALACNLPVVTVDVGDVRDWLDGLEGCVVCEDDSAETIARALEEVLSGEDPFDGRSVARVFDAGVVAERLVEIYLRVLRPAPLSR